MAGLKEYLINFVNFVLLLAFAYLSTKTLIVFINGNVAYDVRKGFDDENIYFPSITLCPAQRRYLLVNLKIKEIIDDFSITPQQVEGYRIYGTISGQSNVSGILNTYSFELSEIFSQVDAQLVNTDSFTGFSKYVDIKNFTKEIAIFNKTKQASEQQYGIQIPIRVKQIMNVYGRCFNLFTHEKPTIEQKIQGWKISLVPELNGYPLQWQLYIGPHGLDYPTFSPTISHELLSLSPNTDTFLTFKREHDLVLGKRGYFDSKEYCKPFTYKEAVKCYKKCLLNTIKITCVPKELTVFSDLGWDTCKTMEESDAAMRVLIGESIVPKYKCDCLDPCDKWTYQLKVKNTEFQQNSTVLRINAETFSYSETEQHLVYNVEDLLIAIGGYLGLFIGFSLKDLWEMLLSSLQYIFDKFNAKNK